MTLTPGMTHTLVPHSIAGKSELNYKLYHKYTNTQVDEAETTTGSERERERGQNCVPWMEWNAFGRLLDLLPSSDVGVYRLSLAAIERSLSGLRGDISLQWLWKPSHTQDNLTHLARRHRRERKERKKLKTRTQISLSDLSNLI